jgi:hypothetical protein
MNKRDDILSLVTAIVITLERSLFDPESDGYGGTYLVCRCCEATTSPWADIEKTDHKPTCPGYGIRQLQALLREDHRL